MTVVRKHPLARVEEALHEEPEAVADLIDDLRADAAHLVGLPEDRDLLCELGLELPVLGAAHSRLIETGKDCRDASVSAQEGTAGCLGRMCGQHELERDRGKPFGTQFLWYDGDARERVLERLARRQGILGVLASAPQPVMLLGRVRELEVETERSEDARLLLRRQRPHRLADDPRVSDLARPSGRGADLLLGGEKRFALLLDEHRSQHRAEQTDVSPQAGRTVPRCGPGLASARHLRRSRR